MNFFSDLKSTFDKFSQIFSYTNKRYDQQVREAEIHRRLATLPCPEIHRDTLRITKVRMNLYQTLYMDTSSKTEYPNRIDQSLRTYDQLLNRLDKCQTCRDLFKLNMDLTSKEQFSKEIPTMENREEVRKVFEKSD